MAGQSGRRWGVTDPISRAPPTDAELALDASLLDELRSQNTFEAPEETEKRFVCRHRHHHLRRADALQGSRSPDAAEGRRGVCSSRWPCKGPCALRYRERWRQDLHLWQLPPGCLRSRYILLKFAHAHIHSLTPYSSNRLRYRYPRSRTQARHSR